MVSDEGSNLTRLFKQINEESILSEINEMDAESINDNILCYNLLTC